MALSPMMQHFKQVKEQYKDCIIFYRLGDFYEMFYDDAILMSKELELTLTGKECGEEERAPMCGIPHHSYEIYLNKLIEKGYKVAICEQLENPKLTRGIVKRDVVRVVTPGTNTLMQTLDESKNNYLMCIFATPKYEFGIALCDITTGEFLTTQVNDLNKVQDEINKFIPAEIICNELFLKNITFISTIKDKLNITTSSLEKYYFEKEAGESLLKQHFKVTSLNGFGLNNYPLGIIASSGLLKYLYDTQKISLSNLIEIKTYSTNEFMLIDTSSRRNLELCETLRDKQKKGTLLWVLDKTKTAMGARLLRKFIEQPLVNTDKINERLDTIEKLTQNIITREEIREYLGSIYDLERIMSKISYKSANPRDLISFKTSISWFPHIKQILKEFDEGMLFYLYKELDELKDLYILIENAIVEEPPILITEGGIIKEGYDEELDKLKKAKENGKIWLTELEEKEKVKTGIKNLKIKYNKIFGYYFDVTNSYKKLVPEYFIRKQTLTNSERYTTEELEVLAENIMGAEEKLNTLEYDIFVDIREKLGKEVKRISNSAHIIALLDVFSSLAFVAERNNFIRPKLNNNGVIEVKNGRHPVIEQMLGNDMFIKNDTILNNNEKIAIITGPNMAGKSTYMRQVALIVIMAQIGSFVPAAFANISIVDKVFTRVGASDDLASGQSTFMVEMSEVANILRNATENSLLILDEIGRGTSTFDGLSIAWSVVEYISKKVKAKTLFATHYHELTELEGKIDNITNYCIAVKEKGDDIIFLRKIIKGGADKSYGIQVAKLAGVPQEVIERAKELVKELTINDITEKIQKNTDVKNIEQINEEPKQLAFNFNNDVNSDIIEEIKFKNLSNITPINALIYLNELQNRLRGK